LTSPRPRTLNLGILAHVDAGKTSLTERLLYQAGVITEIGSVDAGSTQTDSLALERQRGITIKSAVVSFVVDGVTVNLIDTPGHPDFIAEVERVLSLLDGAILVVSAVEGIQAQTRVLMRTLRRLKIPTLIFVNKIDRSGAQGAELLPRLTEKLSPTAVLMGSVSENGSKTATFVPRPTTDDAADLVDHLAEHDPGLLTAYVENAAAVSFGSLQPALARQTRHAWVHPVFFGSAITGAGVPALTAAITRLLPTGTSNVDGPVAGTVFKIERGPSGERIAYTCLRSGRIKIRDRLDDRIVTAISLFENGTTTGRTDLTAGRIGKIWGLGEVRIGDDIGLSTTKRETGSFAPPTLETIVTPAAPEQRGALHLALSRLAEQDPLINLHQDGASGQLSVSLYGEVQKEVIQATLADEFGLDVQFHGTTTLHIERPVGTGAAVEVLDQDVHPFLAGIGLRIDPAPIDTGPAFRLEVELGSMPPAFFTAIGETVARTLEQGLYGWPVLDTVVTLTYNHYLARQSHAHAVFDKSMSSTAGDFRGLTPLVLMSALARAGTRVHEPMHRFRLEFPADTLGPVLSHLARLRAVPGPPMLQSTIGVIEGDLPAAEVHTLTQRLPGLTHGDGVLESRFDHYRSVVGEPPARPRR
jgi:ribosomal protection tetracycline resistance protein